MSHVHQSIGGTRDINHSEQGFGERVDKKKIEEEWLNQEKKGRKNEK